MQAAYNRGSFASNSSSGRQLLEVSATFEHPPTHFTILHQILQSSTTFEHPPPNSRLIQNILQSSTKFFNPPPNSSILHQILPSTTKFCNRPLNFNRCVSTPPSTPLFKHSTICPLFLFLQNPLHQNLMHLETFTIQHNWHFVFLSHLVLKDAACNLFLTLEHLKRLLFILSSSHTSPSHTIPATATTHFICIISSNPQGLNCADIKLRAMTSTYFLRTLQPVSIHPFIQNIHGRLTLKEFAQLLIIIHEAAPVINLK